MPVAGACLENFLVRFFNFSAESLHFCSENMHPEESGTENKVSMLQHVPEAPQQSLEMIVVILTAFYCNYWESILA